MYKHSIKHLSAICLSVLTAVLAAGCIGNSDVPASGTVGEATSAASEETSATASEKQDETTVSDLFAESSAPTEETTVETDIPTKSEEHLNALREQMKNTNSIAAICLLGYYEGPTEDMMKSYSEAYPVFAEIPRERWVTAEGYEYYCIVPCDEKASVTVNQWVVDESNDYMGEAAQELYRSESGEPIIVCGNISDIIPNLRVTITAPDGANLEFNPMCSMKDGKVIVPDSEPYLLDFTDYSILFPSE